MVLYSSAWPKAIQSAFSAGARLRCCRPGSSLARRELAQTLLRVHAHMGVSSFDLGCLHTGGPFSVLIGTLRPPCTRSSDDVAAKKKGGPASLGTTPARNPANCSCKRAEISAAAEGLVVALATMAPQRPWPKIEYRLSRRAASSAGEHSLHTGGVTGSILVPPTIGIHCYPTSFRTGGSTSRDQ